jgi:hypothetical protein
VNSPESSAYCGPRQAPWVTKKQMTRGVKRTRFFPWTLTPQGKFQVRAGNYIAGSSDYFAAVKANCWPGHRASDLTGLVMMRGSHDDTA